MPVLPLIPIHILYDGGAIDEKMVLEYVIKLPKYMKSDMESQCRIRLNLVCMGYSFAAPNLEDRQVDLRGAFENVLCKHKELRQGTGNPEILILLGAQPANDWQIAQEEIENQFRGLILTYWFEKGDLSDPRSSALDDLLKKISRPDPNPRHKVISYQTPDDIRKILDDIFGKLAGRLDLRLASVGRTEAVL